MINNLVDSCLMAFKTIGFIIVIGLSAECIVSILHYIMARIFGDRLGNIIVNYISFIGVIHHELAHAIMAFLTGAKIIDIKLFKLFSCKDGVLGSVTFIPRGNEVIKSVQKVLASFAPAYCGIITLVLIGKYLSTNTVGLLAKVIILFCMISIALHINLSKQDIKNAASGIPVTFLFVWLVYFIMTLF